MTKLTKKDLFAMVRGAVEKSGVDNIEELTNFIDHEIELLNKKAESRKSVDNEKTKAQNELVEKIYNALADLGKTVTITELQAEIPELAVYTNQKLSAMIKKLVDTGRVTKVVDKKKSYFKIAE